MEAAKNSLLIDIIDILAINGTQHENLENIICDVETKFVERGRSTKNLLNKIEDSIKIGTDLGLIATNDDKNTIRLKFNPHKKPNISMSRIQDTDEYNGADNDSDLGRDSRDDFKDYDEKGSESEREYDEYGDNDGQDDNNNNDYSSTNEKPSNPKMPQKSKSIIPNYYPSTSRSQTRSVGRPARHQVKLEDKLKKRKASADPNQRRIRRKY